MARAHITRGPLATFATFSALALTLACASKGPEAPEMPAELADASAEAPADPEDAPASDEAEEKSYTPEELCKRLRELQGKDGSDTAACVQELESRRLQDTGVYDAYAVCVIAAESTEAADACEES